MNISNKEIQKICFECGGCINQCPTNAISYIQNKDLSIKLKVDKNKCIDCSLCVDICPSYQSLTNKEYFDNRVMGNYRKLFIGYSLDIKQRKKSSSGGIITALLKYMLENKMVEKVVISKIDIKHHKLNPYTSFVSDVKKLKDYCGSIYMQTKPNELIDKTFINANERIAFVGLPCHIQSIGLLKKKYPILDKRIFTIGLFCGRNSTKDLFYYILKKLNIKEKNINNFSFRTNGWPGDLIVNSEKYNRNIFFLIPWLNMWYHQKGCHFCQDVFADFADISIGDTWIPEFMKEESDGYSSILIRSSVSEKIISEMHEKQLLSLKDLSKNDLIDSQKFQIAKKIKFMPYKLIHIYRLKNFITRENSIDLLIKEKIECWIIYIMDKLSKTRFVRKFLEILPLRFWGKLQGKIRK